MKWVDDLNDRDRFFVYLSAFAIVFASIRIVFFTSGEKIKAIIKDHDPTQIIFSYKQREEPESLFHKSDFEIVKARVAHLNQRPRQKVLQEDARQLVVAHPEMVLNRIDFEAPFDKRNNLYKKQMAELKRQAENYHDDDEAMTTDMVRQMQRDGDMAW